MIENFTTASILSGKEGHSIVLSLLEETTTQKDGYGLTKIFWQLDYKNTSDTPFIEKQVQCTKFFLYNQKIYKYWTNPKGLDNFIIGKGSIEFARDQTNSFMLNIDSYFIGSNIMTNSGVQWVEGQQKDTFTINSFNLFTNISKPFFTSYQLQGQNFQITWNDCAGYLNPVLQYEIYQKLEKENKWEKIYETSQTSANIILNFSTNDYSLFKIKAIATYGFPLESDIIHYYFQNPILNNVYIDGERVEKIYFEGEPIEELYYEKEKIYSLK